MGVGLGVSVSVRVVCVWRQVINAYMFERQAWEGCEHRGTFGPCVLCTLRPCLIKQDGSICIYTVRSFEGDGIGLFDMMHKLCSQ